MAHKAHATYATKISPRTEDSLIPPFYSIKLLYDVKPCHHQMRNAAKGSLPDWPSAIYRSCGTMLRPLEDDAWSLVLTAKACKT